jgi:hypothetical protein
MSFKFPLHTTFSPMTHDPLNGDIPDDVMGRMIGYLDVLSYLGRQTDTEDFAYMEHRMNLLHRPIPPYLVFQYDESKYDEIEDDLLDPPDVIYSIDECAAIVDMDMSMSVVFKVLVDKGNQTRWVSPPDTINTCPGETIRFMIWVITGIMSSDMRAGNTEWMSIGVTIDVIMGVVFSYLKDHLTSWDSEELDGYVRGRGGVLLYSYTEPHKLKLDIVTNLSSIA